MKNKTEFLLCTIYIYIYAKFNVNAATVRPPPPPLLLHKRGDEIFKKMALMWGMEVLLQMGGGEPGMGGGVVL